VIVFKAEVFDGIAGVDQTRFRDQRPAGQGGGEALGLDEAEVIERGDEDPVLDLVGFDQGQHLLLQLWIVDDAALDLDVGDQVRRVYPRTVLVEGRDRMKFTAVLPRLGCIESLELCEGIITDATAAIGGAVHRLVVDDDDVSVLRQLDIELDAVTLCFERLVKGHHRVLWVKPGCAPVCIDSHGTFLCSLNSDDTDRGDIWSRDAEGSATPLLSARKEEQQQAAKLTIQCNFDSSSAL
jgi:hypothetical protein